MTRTKLILLSLAAAMQGGCVSLLPETAPPKPRYHLEAVEAGALAGEKVTWTLVVEDPRTSRVYDSVRIAVTPSPGKVEYLAGAEWADRAPRLFQTALIQSLEDSGRILGVGDRSAVPIGDIVLHSDIRKLEFNVIGGERKVVASIYARLSDGKGTIYASQLFTAEARSESQRANDIVAAFNIVTSAVIEQMSHWTFERGEETVGSKS